MKVTDNSNPSTTKRGPGRVHVEGHKRATPVKSKGTGFGFAHRTISRESPRDTLIRAHGRRQGVKMMKAQRRGQRELTHDAASAV